MRTTAVIAVSSLVAFFAVACNGGPGGGNDAGGGDDAGDEFCCPIDEPEEGASCSDECSGCRYEKAGTCKPRPVYACTDGTWEQTDTDEPHESCRDGGVDAGDTGGDTAPDARPTRTLTLDMSNSPTPLPMAGENYQWEGWLVDGQGNPTSTGTFEAGSGDGTYEFDIPASATEGAEKFVLTMEPKPDDDPAPSNTKLLAGTLDSGEAELSTESTLGDFSNASGTYALSAPTASDSQAKATHGIWFLRPAGTDGGTPDPGFQSLPDLEGKGWKYEGWVVDTSVDGPAGAHTTGKFADTAESWKSADQDGAGPSAGPNTGEAPDLPGSDFVGGSPGGNDFDLTAGGSWETALTVEPSVDGQDPAPGRPYPLKIFNVKIDSDTDPGQGQAMTPKISDLPTGKVSIDS